MKWLERLTYGADSCRFKFDFGHPATGKHSLSIQQYKWVHILSTCPAKNQAGGGTS